MLTQIRFILRGAVVRETYNMDATTKPWAFLGGSLGAHFIHDWEDLFDLRFTNGVLSPVVGTLYFDSIEIEASGPISIIPRKGWTVSGNRLTIGNGGECFPPRACLHVRMVIGGRNILEVLRSRRQNKICMVGGLRVPMPTSLAHSEDWRENRLLNALATGMADPAINMHSMNLGLWRPYDYPEGNLGGGHEIDTMPGWHQNIILGVLLHDLTAERHPTDCFKRDGLPEPEPVGAEETYTQEGGYGKTTQLSAFCDPVAGQPFYNDVRKPKRANDGNSYYEDALIGKVVVSGGWASYQPGFRRHNRQHGCRRTDKAQALLSWGFTSVKIDLMMDAYDAAYTWSMPVLLDLMKLPAGIGSDVLGRRELSWTADIWFTQTASFFANLRTTLINATLRVKMPNRQILRYRYGVAYGFIPDPYADSGLPVTEDNGQTMEFWLYVFELARAGKWDEVREACESLFFDSWTAQLTRGLLGSKSIFNRYGYIPKWVAVAKNGGRPYSKCTLGADHGDYFDLIAIGLMLCKALEDQIPPDITRWADIAVTRGIPNQPKIITENGKITQASYNDLYTKAIHESTARPQLVFLVSALERWLHK